MDRLGMDRSAPIRVHLAPLTGGGIGLPEPYELVPEVEQFTDIQPTEGEIDMAKKSKKRTRKQEPAPKGKLKEVVEQEVAEPELPQSEEQAPAAPAEEAPAPTPRAKRQPKLREAFSTDNGNIVTCGGFRSSTPLSSRRASTTSPASSPTDYSPVAGRTCCCLGPSLV